MEGQKGQVRRSKSILSIYILCIRESNYRNDTTCLLHLVLGIIM